MVTIRIKKTGNPFTDAKVGEWICEALRGNRAYIDSDILVNYDGDPEHIIICLGENNDNDLTLDFEWPSWISHSTWPGGERSDIPSRNVFPEEEIDK